MKRAVCCFFALCGLPAVRADVIVEPGEAWTPLVRPAETIRGSALDFRSVGRPDAGRFNGINLIFDACFPKTAADRDYLLDRLEELGYNAIRLHHCDNRLIAGHEDDCRAFDELVAAAARRGFALTFDLYCSRDVSWRAVGIDRGGVMKPNVFKALVLTHPPALDDWKAFVSNRMTRINAVTGVRYADDPAIAFLTLVNEGMFSMGWPDVRMVPEVAAAWDGWRTEKGLPPREFGKLRMDDAELQAFAGECEMRVSAEQIRFLRSLGVKARLSSANCRPHTAAKREVRRALYDWVDNHRYIDPPKFPARRWSPPYACDNTRPADAFSLRLDDALSARVPGKPYVLTEWNWAAPGRYRSAAALVYGAFAAKCGADGMFQFAFANSVEMVRSPQTVPDVYAVSADPIQIATARIMAAAFGRGDFREGLDFSSDAKMGVVTASSPRTCGGFAECGAFRAGVLAAEVSGAPATVAAISLDGRKLTGARRILVVHLTDAQGEGARFSDDRRLRMDKGRSRTLAAKGRAKVSLAHAAGKACCRSLRLDGAPFNAIPVSFADGRIVFVAEISDENPTFYYEVTVE